ncbi:MAG: ParB/RepB/Spo0J family partition protein [bacterium]|nr:ParB/RepB/Spo0J family partition protein [bacterium]
MELREIPPEKLDLSLGRLRLMPEAAVREKEESLRSKGQLSPLVAAEIDGVLVLVDGFMRQAAARRLGLEHLVVEVVRVSAVQMKAQVYLRNRDRGMGLIEECRLVCELCETDGLNQVEVADLLERHKSWVCRRLGLYRGLSPRLWEDASVGLLDGGSLRRLARLPTRNQEELVTVARRDDLKAQETSALVHLWSRAEDPEARQYLLDNPRGAIELSRAASGCAADPRLGEAGSGLLRDLVMVQQVILRLTRRLREGLGAVPDEGLCLLREAASRAQQAWRSALRETQKRLQSDEEEEE